MEYIPLSDLIEHLMQLFLLGKRDLTPAELELLLNVEFNMKLKITTH